jgi:hypothetical protein
MPRRHIRLSTSPKGRFMDNSRRSWLKLASGTAVAAPLTFLVKSAWAAQNDSMRKSLQYQPTPKDGKQCSGCVQFVPGKTAADAGGCKIIAGDTEISPTGYCLAFVKK